MRASAVLTLLGACLALASPAAHHHLHKKAIATDIVTDIVFVTVFVTEGELAPTAAATTVHVQQTVVVTDGELAPTAAATTVYVQHTVYVSPVEAAPSTTSATADEIKPTASELPTSTYVPPPPPPPAPTTSNTPPPPPITSTTPPAPATEAPAPTTAAAPVETAEAEAVAAYSAPPAAASTASTSADALSGVGVDSHNSVRASHSAGNVSWNSTLASYAAITANTCVFAHDMTEGGGGYGQNLAVTASSSSDAWTLESALQNAVVSAWYGEASAFAGFYGQESPVDEANAPVFLHFTQVVWKSSLEVGCAVTLCPTSNQIFNGMYAWLTVCNYFPQGNVMGHFAENVLPS